MKRIAVLGSTGSVGRNALEVIRTLGPGYRVAALGARDSWKVMRSQIGDFHPVRVAMADPEGARALRGSLNGLRPDVLDGPPSLAELIAPGEIDLAVVAVVGTAGLALTHRALSLGIPVALANKESMVMAGGLLRDLSRRTGAQILPVDSEHNALFQLLEDRCPEDVDRVVLTSSGGPFREATAERMAEATPEEALKHPTWRMGPKITIDSATLMNKALEIIEARWLFDLPASRIEVLVHPQSVVHALAVLRDGTVLAHLGHPDMRAPLQHALTWPARAGRQVRALDLAEVGRLTFERADEARFPSLGLGRRVADLGGTSGAVLNAANEIAVEAFLARRIPLPRIAEVVRDAIDAHAVQEATLESVAGADAWARARAREAC